MPQPTLYDVAREAGVSTATVSRVLHGQDKVSQVTRQRVLGVIEALGYVPDAAAQSMARKRKEAIGLMAVESRSPGTEVERDGLLFLEEVWRGVETSLSQIEWSLLISSLNPEDPERSFRRMLRESAKVDGLLITEGIVGSFGSVDGQRAVREILGLPRAHWPDAIVCANDQMAIGAIRELLAAGVRVPADVAVVGFDDVHGGALLSPALTTVRQQVRLLAERACTRLLERIVDPMLPRHVELMPIELVLRESCGCPAR